MLVGKGSAPDDTFRQTTYFGTLKSLQWRLPRACDTLAKAAAVPRRMACILTNQEIMPQFFFPEKAGSDDASTPYLETLAAYDQ